jgi:tRNA pseudouridine38-40 synthase
MDETRRLKLIVSYDGRDLVGWQSQKHGRTIQDQIERSFAKICGRRIAVTGAGRTDAGVHALGQCAHADVPAGNLKPAEWLRALNGTLPRTIRIMRAHFVSEHFHARFSAQAKLYRYRILNSAVLLPLELGRAWHVPHPLDLKVLKEAADLFLGRHDFAGFAANRGKMETDTTRTIESLRIVSRGDTIVIEVWGDGFLYKMVRMMVGALARCALGKEPVEAIALRLENGGRVSSGSARVARAGFGVPPKQSFLAWETQEKFAKARTPSPARGTHALPGMPGVRVVAPAEGLYLVRIRY